MSTFHHTSPSTGVATILSAATARIFPAMRICLHRSIVDFTHITDIAYTFWQLPCSCTFFTIPKLSSSFRRSLP